MGFLDSLFGKKGKDYEKVSLESLEEAAKKRIAEGEENFHQDATNFFSQMKNQKEKLKSSLLKLSDSKINDKVDPQLEKVAITSRKSFVRKVEVLAEDVAENFSFDSLSGIYNSFLANFKEIDAGTVAEFASIKEVFKNDAHNVVGEMKKLKGIFDEFHENLEKKRNEIEPFEEIERKIKIIREENGKLEGLRRDLENISSKKDQMQKENEMTQSSLKSLDDSDEWKHYVEMKKEVGKKESEKTEIISQVVQKFSSIERPLKKLNNLSQKIEIEMDKKMLEKYLSSPFDAFLEDYERKAINSALKQAEKYIEENKIDEKKSLDKIKELISENTFSKLAEEWQRVSGEIQELKQKIEDSEVAEKKGEILKSISDRENEMKKFDKNKIEEVIRDIEQDNERDKEELQQLARDKMKKEVDFGNSS